jgi:DNA-binding NtrC family response regulator
VEERAMKKKILVVDDEPRIVNSLEVILSEKGYVVSKASSGAEAIELIHQEEFDLVIADLILPGMTGLELLKTVKKDLPDLPVFIVTTFATINAAVIAMREGAEDFITKPILESEIRIKIERAIERYRILRENVRLRKEIEARYSYENHGYISRPMHEVYHQVEEFSQNDRPVWINGEAGTGSEEVAKSIHYNSLRKESPFIKVDCSILPKNVQHMKLFGGRLGHKGPRDSITPGEIDLAQSGSLFLENIEDLSVESQATLFEYIEKGVLPRNGAEEEIDVRIICSSTRDLGVLVQEEKFRQDLYYQLSVLPIFIPPLRDRKEDILPLANKYIVHWNEEHNREVRSISQDALDLLRAYHWPGNNRELENVIERAVLLARKDVIEPDNLLINIVDLRDGDPGLKQLSLDVMEKEHITRVLEYTNWNKTKAARILGINRKTLLEKRKKYNIS